VRQRTRLTARLTDRSGGLNPVEDAPLGTAVLLLHFHGDGNLVRLLWEDPEKSMAQWKWALENKPMIWCVPPVPKNWVLPCGPFPRDREAIEFAVTVARHLAGEGPAIDSDELEKFRRT